MKQSMLRQLDKATDKAATIAIRQSMPIPSSTPGMWVGNTHITQNDNGFYNIYALDKKILFKDIIAFDIATIISQRYTGKEFKAIEKILVLETEYAKYHTDMMHYLHCLKGAKKRRDYDTMAILEDKFQIAEIRAKKTKNSITLYKRLK